MSAGQHREPESDLPAIVLVIVLLIVSVLCLAASFTAWL